LLSFTPAGAPAVTPTLSESGYTTGQANDDGLFDALYSFVVPASLTTGTLAIGPGTFTGTEFTLYTAEDLGQRGRRLPESVPWLRQRYLLDCFGSHPGQWAIDGDRGRPGRAWRVSRYASNPGI
jgi:hypothetical protein